MSMTDEAVLAFEKDLEDMVQYVALMGTLLELDVTNEDAKADNPVEGILLGSYTTVRDIQDRFKSYL